MTRPPADAGPRVRRGWILVVGVVGVLAAAGAGYWTVQTLRHDDCTATTNPMPDGSHITITTCS
ncbi:MAG: hypothetical protein EON89_15130 [Brevundimonas sp.]|nr:MAG: hypothetical protein EON89_15130 [Brevundimonas sp.]